MADLNRDCTNKRTWRDAVYAHETEAGSSDRMGDRTGPLSAAQETRSELVRSKEARELALVLREIRLRRSPIEWTTPARRRHHFSRRRARRPKTWKMRSGSSATRSRTSAKAFQAERDAFNEAVRTESNRIATELAPTHKAAVRRIATAIEELSRAVTAERAVREEFARLAPEQTSARSALDGIWGSLADPNGMLSNWARTARKLGYLEG